MAGTPAFTCLIVEDDAAFADMASQVVRAEGGSVVHCGNIASARSVTAARSFDLALLDNHLPDGKGYDFFSTLTRRDPEMPITMVTGLPDLGEAVALTRNGLFDYLPKPLTVDALTACLRRALQRLRTKPAAPSITGSLGDSPAMRDVLEQLRQVARHTTTTVLITGETGTGKDVAARTLHALSHPSVDAPFVAVNCAALPAEMFESELFGAERGAYTGADRKRQGLVAAAAGGTLFLDEIGEVTLALQA
jgi:DNA-binding NtrC family response regulator